MDITKLKPSVLISLALTDLELCEVDPDYKVFMESWHERNPYDADDYTCSVCLAGAVMAQSLGSAIERDAMPYDYSPNIERVLRGLDKLRVGRISDAFVYFVGGDPYAFITLDGPVADREIVEYSVDADLFKVQMHGLADELEAKGY